MANHVRWAPTGGMRWSCPSAKNDDATLLHAGADVLLFNLNCRQFVRNEDDISALAGRRNELRAHFCASFSFAQGPVTNEDPKRSGESFSGFVPVFRKHRPQHSENGTSVTLLRLSPQKWQLKMAQVFADGRRHERQPTQRNERRHPRGFQDHPLPQIANVSSATPVSLPLVDLWQKQHISCRPFSLVILATDVRWTRQVSRSRPRILQLAARIHSLPLASTGV